jgi:segregation and condensation protein A
MDYQVDLPVFHGPLDLLLYLVKHHEVDVRDIPIAKIAEQFRDYLEVIQAVDVENAGDFLVMAATLMEIKSRMLLPREAEAEAEADDPRLELVKQLIEYRKFKDAAKALEARAEEQGRRWPREAPPEPARPGGTPPVRPVELWDLVSAFGRIMREAQALQPRQIVVDETPQHVYQQAVRDRLATEGRLPFRSLFTPPYERGRLVGLFLAVLELIKLRQLCLEQDGLFGEIWLTTPAEPHGPNEEGSGPSE